MTTIEEVKREAHTRYRKSPDGKLWYRLCFASMIVWAVFVMAVAVAMLAAYTYEGDYQYVGVDGSGPVVEVVVSEVPHGKLVVNGVNIRPDLEMTTPGPRVPRGLVVGEAIVVGLATIGLWFAPNVIDERKRRRCTDELIAEWARNGNVIPPIGEGEDGGESNQ